MRLHALEGMDEEAATTDIDGTLLGDDAALDVASRPEGVSHFAPWSARVCAKGADTVLADDEAWSGSRELDVDNAAGVGAGLDVVALSVLGQGNAASLGMEAIFVLVEAIVRQRVRRPQIRCVMVGVENLGVELACHPDTAGDDRQRGVMAGAQVS